MSFYINNIFTTVTSNINNCNGYIEIEPHHNLRPFIKCFWEYKPNSLNQNETRVIPDICMDIIFSFEDNSINVELCGINNVPFVTDCNNCMFAIRFYAWSIILFADNNLKNTLNNFLDVKEYFSDFQTIHNDLIYAENIFERKKIAENYLYKKINPDRQNNDVMNSIYYIIKNNCKLKVNDLSNYCFKSRRQLERDFIENTGVSPKQMIDLVRYQKLWQDCLKPNFNILNSVDKLGFYDQSHLLNEFKKYHGISISKALQSK